MEFALFKTVIHWSFERREGSIPFLPIVIRSFKHSPYESLPANLFKHLI